VKRVELTDRHRSTGRTLHRIDDEEMQRPTSLEIVQYSGDPGFYLFYCDSSGQAMTDTYHDSLDLALRQATREFSVHPEEWTDVDEFRTTRDPKPSEDVLRQRNLVRPADRWQLRLLKVGDHPLSVMRVLVSSLKLPLGDVQRLTKSVPLVILTFATESEGLTVLAQLKSSGASAEINPKSDV